MPPGTLTYVESYDEEFPLPHQPAATRSTVAIFADRSIPIDLSRLPSTSPFLSRPRLIVVSHVLATFIGTSRLPAPYRSSFCRAPFRSRRIERLTTVVAVERQPLPILPSPFSMLPPSHSVCDAAPLPSHRLPLPSGPYQVLPIETPSSTSETRVPATLSPASPIPTLAPPLPPGTSLLPQDTGRPRHPPVPLCPTDTPSINFRPPGYLLRPPAFQATRDLPRPLTLRKILQLVAAHRAATTSRSSLLPQPPDSPISHNPSPGLTSGSRLQPSSVPDGARHRSHPSWTPPCFFPHTIPKQTPFTDPSPPLSPTLPSGP